MRAAGVVLATAGAARCGRDLFLTAASPIP